MLRLQWELTKRAIGTLDYSISDVPFIKRLFPFNLLIQAASQGGAVQGVLDGAALRLTLPK